MLGWLDRFFGGVASSIGSAVSSAVHWALHALASVVFGVFGAVRGAWARFNDAVGALGHALDTFGLAMYQFGGYVLHHLIPAILKWAAAQLARLSADLAKLYDYVKLAFDAAYKWIDRQIHDVTQWAIRDIWDPLKAYADQIWSDLKLWGYTAWWWITHLADLAEAMVFHIVASIEKHAFQVARMLGIFFTALIRANLKQLILLIEDIITAVF